MPLWTGKLPQLSAPTLRVTRTADKLTQYLQGDLEEIRKQAPLWVRATAAKQIDNQIRLGNSRQYSSVVDGSPSKPVERADRKVQVFFVGAVLARNLMKAKRVLEAAVRRVLKTRTGLLATGWQWYVQRGGSSGPIQFLGDAVPPELALRPGDALILAPRAAYAFFGDYFAARLGTFVPRVRARRKGSITRQRRPPRGFGFMAYAAKSIRPELRRIGVAVVPGLTTQLAPADTHARRGVPILILAVSRKLMQRPG